MHPIEHSKNSVRKWGGRVEDYLPVHDFLDDTKQTFADARHRAILHNTYGIFLAEKFFGHVIINSDGKEVPVRYICERHIQEDCGGKIPTVQDWLKTLPIQPWMSKGYKIEEEEQPEEPSAAVENTLVKETSLRHPNLLTEFILAKGILKETNGGR